MSYNSKKHTICIAISVFLVVICLFLIAHVFSASRESPVVKTKHGLVKGVRAKDGDYVMYMGIPYAKINESNPFGNAIPYTQFDSVFHANDDSAICPQKEDYNNTVVGKLDCLHLHINVPNTARGPNKLPVLVYIFGGSYEVGFVDQFSYGGKFLMPQNIILITVNYRLGPYGFLCLDTPEIPGNQGLKDQILALRWIKNNIEAFGGDSSNITLAGGINVDFHLAFGEEDLFNNAIIGSGILNDGLLFRPSDNTIPLRLAEGLGLLTKDMDEAISFLTTQDPKSVITSSTKLKIEYAPCVEKPFKNVERFITNYTQFVKSNVKNVSILVDQSNNEVLYQIANKNLVTGEHENTIFKEVLVAIFDIDENKLESVVEQVRHFYIGDRKVDNSVKQAVIDFLSDILINYPISKKIAEYIEYGAKIYYSIFSYEGERKFMNDFENVHESIKSPLHVDMIGYLFDASYMRDTINPNDQLIINRITELWANFVKYGNPTPERTTLLPIIWEPVTDKSLPYLNIDLNLNMGTRPFHDRMLFWERFYRQNYTIQRLYAEPWVS